MNALRTTHSLIQTSRSAAAEQAAPVGALRASGGEGSDEGLRSSCWQRSAQVSRLVKHCASTADHRRHTLARVGTSAAAWERSRWSPSHTILPRADVPSDSARQLIGPARQSSSIQDHLKVRITKQREREKRIDARLRRATIQPGLRWEHLLHHHRCCQSEQRTSFEWVDLQQRQPTRGPPQQAGPVS